MHKYMTVTMPDGSIYGVPVEMIAHNRAKHYAHEFDGDIRASLEEDTLPLFESDDYEIQDWAVNNMNWLEELVTLSGSVENFVLLKGDRTPDNYQVKWDWLPSLLGLRPSGRLRYLPDKSVVRFSIGLP